MSLVERPSSFAKFQEGILGPEVFAGVDWDFGIRSKSHPIESIHPYPAKFIGDLPRTLLSNLSIPKGSSVFDPFCGSGTTLVEAQRAGYECVGIDLNPIACLLSRVKTAPLSDGFSETVEEVIAKAQALRKCPVPEIPNLDHWFMPQVSLAVACLGSSIAADKYKRWHDPLRLALSGILVRVSNQDSDTRYAAVEKTVSRDDVFRAFATSAAKIQRALEARSWILPQAKVIEGDTLQISARAIGKKVGIVVTSPPYPNAYEYWLYHKYRMWWLGFDPLAVKEKEIGARAHFFKKDRHTAELFTDQMAKAFALIKEVLLPKGYACFVVGRSKIHGTIVDNAEIIERAARTSSFVTVSRFERTIKSNRKSFNLSHANIKTESVIILQHV